MTSVEKKEWEGCITEIGANMTLPAGSLSHYGLELRRGGVREEMLGDRVGARIWSRLQDMMRAVELVGADYRRKEA